MSRPYIVRFTRVLLWATLILGCAGDKLREYPPSVYLTIAEQKDITFSFSRALENDITKEDAEFVFRLRYFVKKNGKTYYVFSEHHNPFFFEAAFRWYGGQMLVHAGDTTFNNAFTGEVPYEFSVDSVKSLFNQMISE